MNLDKCLNLTQHHITGLLLAVCGLRLGFLFANNLELLGDESYYWDWSRQLAWCYYSKPPMVAWLIGLITRLGGDSTALVRIPAVLLGTVFLGYFYATCQAFYGQRAAALGVLLMLAMPFNVLANILMTIDPPLNCFWMMAVFYLRRALFGGNQYAWLWAGLSTGAAVLSKQVALFLPVLLLVFLWQDPLRRRYLKCEFWLYLVPVIICLLPLLLWNQQHDWVTLAHSQSHFEVAVAPTLSPAKSLQQCMEFLLLQCLLFTPIITFLSIVLAAQLFFRFNRQSAETRFLLLMGPLLLLAILALSTLQKVHGNWPTPFYFTTVILLCGQWQTGHWQTLVKRGWQLGMVMVTLTYLLPLLMPVVVPLLGWQNSQLDPLARMHNWRELALSVDAYRQKTSASFLLVDGHRYLTSELAFYLPDHPTVYRFEKTGLVYSQYEVWPGPIEQLGNTALIISEQADNAISPALTAAFAHVTPLGIIELADKSSHYYMYRAEQLRYWPPLHH